MKNLFLSAAIVLGGLTSFASTSPTTLNTIVKAVSFQDDYTEINVTEVPTAVTDALKKRIQMQF